MSHTPYNVLLILHPTTGAAFAVASDGAVSSTLEASGGALLAHVEVDTCEGAAELATAARAHFLSRGHQPDSMARAVAGFDAWLTKRGRGELLMVRPGVLADRRR